MTYNKTSLATIALLSLTVAGNARADCVIAEATRALDPVEAGFCESDAVFVGTVDTRVETVRAYREEGAERTKHF